MAVFIEAQYQKRIGLPSFSSHSFSVTVRSEVSDFNEVERESSKLYSILQNAVDSQITETGYTPVPLGAGTESNRPTGRTANGQAAQPSNIDQWACSDKQRDLILKIVEEHKLNKQDVEALAKDMFNQPVKVLNKLQASGLIEELLAKYAPKKTNGRGAYQRRGQ
jgi:hypothetical protein